jgi:hypothetical protein
MLRPAQGIPGIEQARKLSMNYTTDFKSIRGQVSAEEWQARVDLAACYRLVDKYGMTDLIYNHITARIPGSQDHLLINLYGMSQGGHGVEPGEDRRRGRDRWKPIPTTASTSPAT